jgi:hypothetical protein
MYRARTAPERRKAIILLVVLALLTLFAIVGISFVFYADSAALAARTSKDGNNNTLPNMSPEECLSLFLDQFLYDVRDDSSGIYSSLRGHSLSRNMYGFNYTLNSATPGVVTQVGNVAPFIGVGRLHYPSQTQLTDPANGGQIVDDFKLINYMDFSAVDGFLRDPECFGSRTGPTQARGPYLGSANVPYTYPDLNNFYLGAIDGGLSTLDQNGNPILVTNLITPSFHREWLFGRLDDPNNPNWMNAVGKYLTVRPRPVDNLTSADLASVGLPYPLQLSQLNASQMATLTNLIAQQQGNNQLFPYPVDRGGSVKNLIGYSGGCDSDWIDIGAPVMRTPDGRLYKMLVAPMILDMEGRININVHGNIMGGTTAAPAHTSLFGLGPWEVNPTQLITVTSGTNLQTLLNLQNEWLHIFTGSTQPTTYGKYGPGQLPVGNPATFPNVNLSNFPATNVGPTIPSPSALGQLAYTPGAITVPVTVPNGLNTQLNQKCFLTFPAGYDNANQTALQSHPLLYGYYAPASPGLVAGTPTQFWNRHFRLSNMDRHLRNNDTGYEAVTSEIERMMPLNFANPNDIPGSLQRMSLITAISGDVNQPGISPYNWNNPSSATNYVVNPATLDQAPAATTPPVFPTPANPAPGLPPGSDFTVDWRSAIVANNSGVFNNNANFTTTPLTRLDLNYPFPNGNHPLASGTFGPLPANITTPNAAGLTPYPTASDTTLVTAVDPYLPAPNQRFDTDQNIQQFQQAQLDRQHLARQIYLRLLAVVGLSPSGATPAAPTVAELQPRRWLAQLAVNMVDYIDNDDISTPFNFYNLHDANPGVANPSPTTFNLNATVTNTTTVSNANLPGPNYPVLPLVNNTSPQPDNTPLYWVFGTELPRVVINEVLMQYNAPTLQAGQTSVQPGQTFTTNVWVELYNPMELKPSANPNVSVANTQPTMLGMPSVATLGQTQNGNNGAFAAGDTGAAYGAYRLLVGDQNMLPTTPVKLPSANTPAPIADNNNVLGLPYNIRGQTQDSDWAANNVITINNIGTQNWYNTDPLNPLYLTPQGFLLVTPPGVVETTATSTTTNKSIATIAPNAASGNTNYPNGTIPANGNGNTVAATPTAYNPAGNPPNLVLQTTSLQFTSTVSAAWTPTNANAGVPMTVTPTSDNNMLQGNGATVMLQRLANPHIPWNQNATLPSGAPNPWYNPYVTIDYLSTIPVYNATNPYNAGTPPATVPSYYSIGKRQPYGGFMNPPAAGLQVGYPPNPAPTGSPNSSTVTNQTPSTAFPPLEHTFGLQNRPSANGNSGPNNWLTHLDRMLISPVELLHVSQYQPHQLTQKFILSDPETQGTTGYMHAPVATWYNETTRLYRVFEFFETRDRLAGFTSGNRTTGKININSIWDLQTFLALCDPQVGNSFTSADVTPIWTQFMKLRSPNYTQGTGWYQVGPTNMVQSQVAQQGSTSFPVGPQNSPAAAYQIDRPFLGLAPGPIGTSPNPASTQYPNGQGVRDTIFRPGTGTNQLFVLSNKANSSGTGGRGDNPYLCHQLLTKIFNNVTCRSNTFAVYLTVGFFEVRDATTLPVKLGAEMNASEGRAVRHRMFAIVDRTVLPPQPYGTKPALYRPSADTSGLVPYWSIIQ